MLDFGVDAEYIRPEERFLCRHLQNGNANSACKGKRGKNTIFKTDSNLYTPPPSFVLENQLTFIYEQTLNENINTSNIATILPIEMNSFQWKKVSLFCIVFGNTAPKKKRNSRLF